MKDKILDIVAEHCVGWKNCEALTEKLFDLYSVSHQRELLIAWEKRRYSLEEWKIVKKNSLEFIDGWLSN